MLRKVGVKRGPQPTVCLKDSHQGPCDVLVGWLDNVLVQAAHDIVIKAADQHSLCPAQHGMCGLAQTEEMKSAAEYSNRRSQTYMKNAG